LLSAFCSACARRHEFRSCQATMRKLHADVLKVGHPGSKNSTTPQFLAAVDPQIAVICFRRGKSVWTSEP
jgi:beta-lactamase superfamily II metal-dependent hydrolase